MGLLPTNTTDIDENLFLPTIIYQTLIICKLYFIKTLKNVIITPNMPKNQLNLNKDTANMLKLLATLSKEIKRVERYIILKNNA